MQSGFGVNFLFWPSEFEENCRWISQRNLMANFDSEFFGLVFPGFQAHPKNSRPKFTSRIVGIPLQFHFLEPKIYSRRFSAYVRDQQFHQVMQKIARWVGHEKLKEEGGHRPNLVLQSSPKEQQILPEWQRGRVTGSRHQSFPGLLSTQVAPWQIQDWGGLSYLRTKSFLLTVGLCCFGLVFLAYGCNSVWSVLLAVENRFGLWKIGLVFFTYGPPPVRKLDFVIFWLRFPHRKWNRRTVSEKTSTVSQIPTASWWILMACEVVKLAKHIDCSQIKKCRCFAHQHVCVCMCMCAWVHVHNSVCMYVWIYIYIHTYIHTYIHIHSVFPLNWNLFT